MFECGIYLVLPIQSSANETATKPLGIRVAKYEFDPGLYPGDEVNVSDLEWGWNGEKPFTFSALVIDRKKFIRAKQDPNRPQDVFHLVIEIEMADKEQIPRMVKILKELNPEKIKDLRLAEEA